MSFSSANNSALTLTLPTRTFSCKCSTLVVPDKARSLKQGAIAPWAKSTSPYYGQTLDALAKHYHFKLNVPFADLPEQARDVLIWGRFPDFAGLGLYLFVAVMVAWGGFFWFQKTRKGFADVL